MRIFGSDPMNNILEKLGLKDGESIDHPWINKVLERAQQKVEARNFDIRKSLLRFDDVLNDQRHVIFSQRRKVIDNTNSFELTDSFLNQIILELIDYKTKNSDIDKKLLSTLSGAFDNDEIEKLKVSDNKIFKNLIVEKFNNKRNERLSVLGDSQSQEIEKNIFTINRSKLENSLTAFEQLHVIGLRSYGQRDPLIEYKKEAFSLFEDLLNKLKSQFIGILINIKIVNKSNQNKTNEVQKEKSKSLHLEK